MEKEQEIKKGIRRIKNLKGMEENSGTKYLQNGFVSIF